MEKKIETCVLYLNENEKGAKKKYYAWQNQRFECTKAETNNSSAKDTP